LSEVSQAPKGEAPGAPKGGLRDSAFVKRLETMQAKWGKKRPFCLQNRPFGAEKRPFFGVKVYWIINRKKN
jgi:hypothetical protein